MKQSKMTNLRVDAAGTKKLRSAMKQVSSIKITINIDSLTALPRREPKFPTSAC